jgi:LysR family hydrogen peroxide-inducible transcriptional activator
MDLRQLGALVAVADHGSFSAAARALFTVQSNVSAHVAHLERELGVELIDRSRGRPTVEGELVVARARQIQRELEGVAADLSALVDEIQGEARIGVIGTTARWLVPQLLQAVRDVHPRIRAVVVEASTTSLVPQLVAGQLDLAVVNLPVDDPELDTVPLFDEDLVLLTTLEHPLASYDEVRLEDLAAHPLLLTPPGTALRDDLEAEATRRGVRLVALAEIDGARLLTSLAFEGFGATIVPSTAVPGWLKGDFTRVPLVGFPARHVGLARRKRAFVSPPARAVGRVLLDVIADRGPRQRGVRVATPRTNGA